VYLPTFTFAETAVERDRTEKNIWNVFIVQVTFNAPVCFQMRQSLYSRVLSDHFQWLLILNSQELLTLRQLTCALEFLFHLRRIRSNIESVKPLRHLLSQLVSIYMHLLSQRHVPDNLGQACLHGASSMGSVTRAPNVLTKQKLIGFKKRSARAQQPTRVNLCHVTRTPSAKEARTRSRDCYVTTPTPGLTIFLGVAPRGRKDCGKALRNMIKQPLSPLPMK
jgi:hypothetical protein